MGNTPSNENGIDRDAFIEEQKRIIREQNEQIQRLASIAENSMSNQQTSQQRQPKRNEFHPSFVQDKPKDKKKINPYHVLGVGENYDESSLKKAYLSRAMETHPDRGGSKEEFQKVTVCYKALMIKLREREKLAEKLKKTDEARYLRIIAEIEEERNMLQQKFNKVARQYLPKN